MRNGSVFARPTWEPRTVGTDGSGSRGVWTTPSVANGNGNSRRGGDRSDEALLPGEATEWPTPTTRDEKDGACETQDVETNAMLGRASVRWPSISSLPAPARGLMREAVGSSLSIETLPDGSRCLTKGPTSRRRLNPLFVERLMGWPEGWTAYAPVEMESWWRKVLRHCENF